VFLHTQALIKTTVCSRRRAIRTHHRYVLYIHSNPPYAHTSLSEHRPQVRLAVGIFVDVISDALLFSYEARTYETNGNRVTTAVAVAVTVFTDLVIAGILCWLLRAGRAALEKSVIFLAPVLPSETEASPPGMRSSRTQTAWSGAWYVLRALTYSRC
jgi:hypothetical protein